jgi:hypothetical protein
VTVEQGDFLEMIPGNFDHVVMNPPFEKLADIDHIRHAWDFLKPGGTLVSVASASVAFNSTKKAQAFREFVDDCGEIIPLPEGAFKQSDRPTNVNTVLVVLEKPAAPPDETPEPVVAVDAPVTALPVVIPAHGAVVHGRTYRSLRG